MASVAAIVIDAAEWWYLAFGDGTKVVTLDLIHHAPSDLVEGV